MTDEQTPPIQTPEGDPVPQGEPIPVEPVAEPQPDEGGGDDGTDQGDEPG